MLGADFEPDAVFRISKIYPAKTGAIHARAHRTGLKVKAGDYLIAVDGQEARSNQDVYSYFQDLAGKLVTLKINSKSTPEGAWEITVKPTAGEAGSVTFDWMDENRRKVAEATGGASVTCTCRTRRSRHHRVRQAVYRATRQRRHHRR